MRQSKKSDHSHMHNSSTNAENAKISAKTHVSKSKKDVRPMSGGMQSKHFSKNADRSRMQQQHHNMSMFDKIGVNSKNQ